MATKTFAKALMAAEDVKAYVGSALYQVSGNNAKIHDGAFVVLGDLAEDTTYANSGDVQYNVYKATAPAAVTDKVVVLSYAGIQEGTIGGNDYKMGINLFDLECPAGRPCRFYRMQVGDRMWLSDGLFASAPTVGKFAELTANNTILTPQASHTADQFGVKILKEDEMTTGQIANGKKYLVEVVEL